MPFCNTTLEDQYINEDPLWTVSGHAVTFHRFGLFIAAIFGLISVVVALFLVVQHARHYSQPSQQRHIIRILLMIPIYSMVSFLSYLYYRKAVYFEVLRDCYEAFAIASFFSLLCNYVAPTLHEQKDYFRGLTAVNWFWGVFGLQKCTGGENKGPFRRPRSGLTWFNICWVGIFQYCLIRVLFTIVSVVTQALGVYCEASLSPAFAHIWTVAFECVSVTIAMFLLVQFYIQLKTDLAEHRPFLKVLCIKLVIFFSFWQTIVISLLSSSRGPLKPSAKLSYQSIVVGIPNVLLCIEMAIFAVMHIFAFPYKGYKLAKSPGVVYNERTGLGSIAPHYQGGPLGLAALLDAFNPWDLVKALARGLRWLFVGYKYRTTDVSYQQANKLHDDTSYAGRTFAATSGTATELGRSDGPFRAGHVDAEDDRAGLLRNSALMPVEPADRTYSRPEEPPYNGIATYDTEQDLGSSQPGYYHAVSSFEERPHLPSGDPSIVHPAYRDGRSPAPPSGAQGWNHWAGATRDESDVDTFRPRLGDRPPTYRSDNPYPDRI